MNKITVIQLLNKIANNEEVPEKIKFNDTTYIYYERVDGHYHYKDEMGEYLDGKYYLSGILNHEVEIIEEDKEIEHYDMFDNFTGFGFGGTDKELLCDLQNNFEHINEELDYLIKAVNELKKGK